MSVVYQKIEIIINILSIFENFFYDIFKMALMKMDFHD